MISIKISDIKNFMSHLLVGNTFDSFCVYNFTATTFNTFNIDGHINRTYYTEDEMETLTDPRFSTWDILKPFCYSLIKGSKTPEKLKFSFLLPSSRYSSIISDSGCTLQTDNIQGLYIHFTYDENGLHAVTATSISIFTLDKTLDEYWDKTVLSFLSKYFSVEKL